MGSRRRAILQRQSSTSKGKRKEECAPESKGDEQVQQVTDNFNTRSQSPGLKSDTEADHPSHLNFFKPDYSNSVEILASNCRFGRDGVVRICGPQASRQDPSTQPRIRIPYEIYCRRRRFLSGTSSLNDRRLLLSELELVLPSNHQYLRDFQLMACERIIPHENLKSYTLDFHFGDGMPVFFDLCCLILLLRCQPIMITNYTQNGWEVDEKYSNLYNHARTSFHPSLPIHRQYLLNFCNGIGPSDWSGYAKRIYDEKIERRRLSCIRRDEHNDIVERLFFTVDIPICWKYLYVGEEESSDDGTSAEEDAEVPRCPPMNRFHKAKSFLINGTQRLKRDRNPSWENEEELKLLGSENEKEVESKDGDIGRKKSITQKVRRLVKRSIGFRAGQVWN